MGEKKKVTGTGGELLMHQLVAQGVEYAFTNTGSAEAGFFDAFLTVPGVQPVLLLAESLVVSAADGYAKAANKPAFVNVHLAAGTRQSSGQLFNAHFDGTPMVVTAALRDNGSFGDHNTLGAPSGYAQMSTVQDVTKARWEVTDARGVPLATRRAFKEAMSMPSGPVYLAFSSPALDAKNVEGVIQAAEPLEMALAPNASTLAKMHDALLNAENPLLMVGPDVHRAGAHREVLELAENYALPTTVGFFDYGAFPKQHPNNIGMIDYIPQDGWDVVICVGYRPNTRSGPSDERWADANTVIAVGHDPAMMGNSFAVDLGVFGNVRHTLNALNGLWKPDHSNLAHVQKRKQALLKQAKERAAKEADRTASLAGSSPIHPEYLGAMMGRTLAENTMLVSENFRAADHTMPFGYGENDWSYVRTYGGSLGYGPGSAIGAQLGAPDRPVTLSIGDGSVMYSSSAFWTMAHYNLPILTVVWNNQQYQTVRTNFASWGGNMKAQNKYPETFLGDPDIDFVLLAKAQGIEGMHVHEPGELEGALKRASEVQAAGEPFLLDVRITNVGAGADQSWYMARKQ
ncbi:MAG TPA: thiamine pyrophosphate-binding protein [Alphaproteobacteria bacterium]|nr:thiamine pyrophosphate-binding protein [Alphaproteobacteria bacterium]